MTGSEAFNRMKQCPYPIAAQLVAIQKHVDASSGKKWMDLFTTHNVSVSFSESHLQRRFLGRSQEGCSHATYSPVTAELFNKIVKAPGPDVLDDWDLENATDFEIIRRDKNDVAMAAYDKRVRYDWGCAREPDAKNPVGEALRFLCGARSEIEKGQKKGLSKEQRLKHCEIAENWCVQAISRCDAYQAGESHWIDMLRNYARVNWFVARTTGKEEELLQDAVERALMLEQANSLLVADAIEFVLDHSPFERKETRTALFWPAYLMIDGADDEGRFNRYMELALDADPNFAEGWDPNPELQIYSRFEDKVLSHEAVQPAMRAAIDRYEPVTGQYKNTWRYAELLKKAAAA